MSDKNFVIFKKNVKKNTEFSRTNKIRLDLFYFAQNEINEKKKIHNDSFSFSNHFSENPKEKKESKFITKIISINSQKTAKDSFDMSSDEDESSEISCDEEII